MNNKKLIFSVLILFVILTLGCVSAAPDNGTSDSSVQTVSVDDANEVTSDNVDTDVNSATNNTKDVVSDPSTVQITKDMDNSAIQTAIDGANDGDTINFENSTYTNINLVVNKSLNLIGNGATLTGTPASGNRWNGIMMILNCSNTNVTGFNFICEGVTGPVMMNTPSTLTVINTTNTIIENNTVTGGRFGIAISSNFNAPNYDAIVRNNIAYNALDAGIQSFGSARTLITNNTVINSSNHGIDVRHGTGPNCTVVNNTVIGGKEGIYIMHSTGHTVENNTIINTTISGITGYGASNTVFDYNNIRGSRIGYLLASGYSNITIGNHNTYNLDFVPMTPTFTYQIVTSDSTLPSYGTYTDSSYTATETNIQAKNVTRRYGSTENSTFTAKLWHDAINYPIPDQTLYVTIDGVTYVNVTDDSGAVNIDISNLTIGTHSVYVSYNGTDYGASNWTGYINVIGEEGYTVTVSDVNMTYKDGSKVVLKLTKDGVACANETVTITVCGKTYTRITDENGTATLNINLYPRTYTVTGAYKGITAQSTVTVNKGTVKYTSVTTNVKRGNNFSFTVLDSKNKVVSGQKVKITVCGKTYYKTTDSKGKVYLKINLNPRTYKITYSLVNNNLYSNGKVTKSTNLVVRK